MRKLLLAAFLSFTVLSISSKSEAQVTINYWNFNNFTTTDTFGSAYNPIPVLKASFSLIDTNKAVITYIPQSGTSTKSDDSAWIDNVAGTSLNAKNGAVAGNSLRVRNPSDAMELRLYIPTTNFNNISVSYALETSSTGSGQGTEAFDYSVDSGATWKTSSITVNGVNVDTLNVAQTLYTSFAVVTIGFGSDTTVNNNPKLVLRMKYTKQNTGTSGNNRLDNIAVTGSYLASAIVVSTPPLGVTLYAGLPDTIIYQTFGFISPVRAVELSIDSGNSWTELGISANDTFVWVVPNKTSSNCFIYVADTTNLIIGQSPKFAIHVPKITVSAPPAAGILLVGQLDTVSYLTFGVVSPFRAVDLSTDSGKTWVELGVSTKDTFSWVVPNDTSSNSFLRVIDQNGIIGMSGKFAILYTKPLPPPPPPAGGLIQYWNFNNLLTTTTYKVPNVPHIDADFSALDTSKAYLEYYLEPGTSSTYGSANGSDNLDGVASADTANLRLGAVSGDALRVRNPVDSIELRWHIPSTGYNNLVVKFTVESSSTSSGDSTQIYSYSVDGGVTWKSSSITVNGANVDTMNTTSNPLMQGANWGLVTVTFGNDLTVNNNPNLIFRIIFSGNTHLLSGNNRFDDFTVDGTQGAPPPPVKDSIAVSAPPAADTLLAGTQTNITYSVTATTGATRTIDYSTNGGTTWTNVATGVTALTYNWTVPATPTSNAIVRVKDSIGVIGLSGKFVIVVPGTVASVTLSGQTVTEGSTTNIMWSASGYLGSTVEIDVAYDGVTWNPIVTNYSADQTSYSWTAPKIPFTGVLIRVTFASGATGTSTPFDIIPTAEVAAGTNSKANIELWPNPATNELNYINKASSSSTITIFDASGNSVLIETANAVGVLDISSLAGGVYYVRITDSETGQVSTSSFVKE